MGNKQKQLDLKESHRTIWLHHSFKMCLNITELNQFPHGLDGLKMW